MSEATIAMAWLDHERTHYLRYNGGHGEYDDVSYEDCLLGMAHEGRVNCKLEVFFVEKWSIGDGDVSKPQ